MGGGGGHSHSPLDVIDSLTTSQHKVVHFLSGFLQHVQQPNYLETVIIFKSSIFKVQSRLNFSEKLKIQV